MHRREGARRSCPARWARSDVAVATSILALGAVLASVVACEQKQPETEPNRAEIHQPAPEQGFTVIANADAPEEAALCLSMTDMIPMHCSNGIPIVGWDWDSVEHSAAEGARWGDYTGILTPRTDGSFDVDMTGIRVHDFGS